VSSLNEKATRGLLWSVCERFGQQGVSFIVQLVLARLLSPEEFGLIAMVVVFIALARGVIDAGFHEALIQKPELDDLLTSTTFYCNLLLSGMMVWLMFVAAPWISAFYDQPDLVPIIKALSFVLVVSAFSRVQTSLMQRDLRFKELAISTLAASLVSGVLAAYLAFRGFGVWSLVAQTLSMNVLLSVMLWVQSGWSPQFIFSLKSLKEILPFASSMFVSNILNNFFQQLYVLVIGRIGNPVELGYYQRADSFKRLATTTSNTLMARITFPIFAKVQDDPERLSRGFIKASRLLVFLFFPFMAVLAAVAEPLVITLIGEKWLPTVPYLQFLCIVGALHPVQAINLNVIKALGAGGLFLRLELMKKGLIVVVLLITYSHGIYAIVIGQVICSFFALMVNGFYTERLIGVGYWQQFKLYKGSLLLSLFVALSVATVLGLFHFIAPLRLVAGLALSAAFGLIGLWFGRKAFEMELKWIRSMCASLPIGGRILSN
jgi:O-antigen/teichoic acid export membrane protein